MRKIKRWQAMFALPVVIGIGSHAFAASCDVDITNDWNSGFGVSVTILNDTTTTIDGWSTSWTFANSTVSQLWNGNVSGTNPYTVTNVGHNQIIAPNESIKFGFNASKNQLGTPAEAPALGGICSSIIENQAPVAVGTASPTVGTVPFDVVFDATQSTDPDNDALNYSWDFGSGDTSTTATVIRSFNTPGTYTATLVVNDGVLSSNTETITIVANEVDPTDDIAYTLNPSASSLRFVSTKKTHVIESHAFMGLSGDVTELGQATLRIDLNSVDTNNTTRDERMKTMLFETSVFNSAAVTVSLDPSTYTTQAVGSTQIQTVVATIDLHGVLVEKTTDVLVSKLSDTTLLVQNVTPVLLNTTDFNLNAGVEALRTIANLSVISYAVPVNFVLVFNKTTTQP